MQCWHGVVLWRSHGERIGWDLLENRSTMLGKNSKRRWEGNCCPEKKGDGRSKLMLAPRMQCAACASALRSAPESLAACSIHPHLEFLPVQLYCSLCQRARGSLLVTSEQVCVAGLCHGTTLGLSGCAVMHIQLLLSHPRRACAPLCSRCWFSSLCQHLVHWDIVPRVTLRKENIWQEFKINSAMLVYFDEYFLIIVLCLSGVWLINVSKWREMVVVCAFHLSCTV